MESRTHGNYLCDVDSIDEAKALLAARELIAEHGNDVARFLQDKIDALMEAGDLEQLSQWFVIRNAVALTLRSGSSIN